MRSDEEDDEDEYYDENEEEDDEGMDGGQNGMNGDADEEEGEGDEGMDDGSDEEGSEEENANEDEDGEGEGDDDEDEDEDEDADADEEDEDDNDDEDEDEQEGEGSEEDEQEGEGEDVDMTVNGEEEGAASEHLSQSSKLRVVTDQLDPPHLLRRGLFKPVFEPNSLPNTLSIEAIVGIPLPSAVHSLATSACSSYLLAGSQDGYVRAYDLWGSVNGAQMMTAQQRSVVGLGETVSKAGVGRGWWANEVEGINGGQVGKRAEPVYSMACEGDALWSLTGTQSGPINMYTLRHTPGHLVHSLKGHTNVVSCMTLLPNEKGFISGSWDGTVREWDLNTGQTVRTYPTHGAQLSSLALRPFSQLPSPTPSPRNGNDEEEEEETAKENISISMGPDFFEKRSSNGDDVQVAEPPAGEEVDKPIADDEVARSSPPQTQTNGDVEMADANTPVSHDSLFGDDDADADGETVPPSVLPTNAATTPTNNNTSPKPKPLGIALPGGQNRPPPITTTTEQPTPSSSSAAPLFVTPQSGGGQQSARHGAADTIPLLSPTSYKDFSDDILLTSSMDGQVVLIDRRVPSYEGTGVGVGRLMPGERAPPWCMSACWLANGNQVLAGRRNGTIDIWDVRRGSSSTAPNLLRTLRTPLESGPISCVVAFPDGRHIATASQDNIRLWNSAEYLAPDDSMKRSRSKPPFKIIAGHHGGTISSMIVDPRSRFLITASGDRGWQGESTKVVLVHEVKW
ncbi:hypothetical protein CI109_103349 [Kwoniella shandongensis]|uniref:Transcription factor spt8 beta-propeller domain-containing protein n=1 Tax=Kwoniella shandongensis TaxID=1734106 RepID=A0A5M6C1N5_9TREE|nr:uncharacterized protein CI109_004430 [Kwoniella shandongensis]KAA5527139.1 hypothetical protein CI109_004430 [Kwoniella shandongensis]